MRWFAVRLEKPGIADVFNLRIHYGEDSFLHVYGVASPAVINTNERQYLYNADAVNKKGLL